MMHGNYKLYSYLENADIGSWNEAVLIFLQIFSMNHISVFLLPFKSFYEPLYLLGDLGTITVIIKNK